MDLVYSIGFNSRFPGCYFDIVNPPITISEGDPVDFKWDDFIDESEISQALEDAWEEEGLCWRASIVLKRFEKGKAICSISLMEEADYHKYAEERKKRIKSGVY